MMGRAWDEAAILGVATERPVICHNPSMGCQRWIGGTSIRLQASGLRVGKADMGGFWSLLQSGTKV